MPKISGPLIHQLGEVLLDYGGCHGVLVNQIANAIDHCATEEPGTPYLVHACSLCWIVATNKVVYILLQNGESLSDFNLSFRLLRSEEHTSELQSLMRISYAVFCLKQKRKKNTIIHVMN